ncbi:MAG TPA: hypothetical protein VMI54_16890 [Polyangiaceae bacterium]|nr:hypothetical protein [Polyangiaceae bacterium]
MMRSLLAVSWTALVLSACGAAGQPDKIQTPDQFIAEEDAEGAKQIAAEKKQESNSGAPTETEDEKVRDWDDKQATLEMKRAARSAETCPDSVTEKAPKGMATVTLLFANDGKVKDSKIDDVYSDKAVGTCVLRAMGSVIVPAYKGDEHTLVWQIDLTGAKQKHSGPKDSGDKGQ